MPKLGVEFKTKQMNDFLLEIQNAKEALDLLEKEGKDVSKDRKALQDMMVPVLKNCMNIYQKNLEALKIGDQQDKIQLDKRMLGLKVGLFDPELTTQDIDYKTEMALKGDESSFKEIEGMDKVLTSGNTFSALLEFFANEMDEKLIIPSLSFVNQFSDELKAKMKALEEFEKNAKESQEEREIQEEASKVLEASEFVQKIDFARMVIESKEDYPSKDYDLRELAREKTDFLMNASYEYGKYAETLDEEKKKQNVKELKNILINKGETPEDALLRADSLLSNRIFTMDDKTGYMNVMLKENLEEFVAFLKSTMGEERTNKTVQDIKSHFSNDIDEVVNPKKGEKKEELNIEELKKDVVPEKSDAIKNYCKEIKFATEAIEKQGDLSPFKQYDLNSIRAAKNKIMFSFLFAYSKVKEDISKEEHEENIKRLTTYFELNDKNNARWRAETLLNNTYTAITENPKFIETIVKDDLQDVLEFYATVVGRDFVEEIILDKDNAFALSEGTIQKVKEIKKESIIQEKIDNAELEDLNKEISEKLETEAKEEKVANEELVEPEIDTNAIIYEPIITELYEGNKDKLEELEVEWSSLNTRKKQNELSLSHNEQLRFMQLNSIINNSKRINKLIENDKPQLSSIFGRLNPVDDAFKTLFAETAARMIKGEKVFSSQKEAPVNTPENALRYLYQLLDAKYINLNVDLKNRQELLAQVKDVCQSKTLEELQNNEKARTEVKELFSNCHSPKDYKKQFEKTLDNVLKGKTTLANVGEVKDKTCNSIAKTMKSMLQGLKEMGVDTNELGFTKDYISEQGFKRINGVDVANELVDKFNEQDLGKTRVSALPESERQAYQAHDKQSIDGMKALFKVKGLDTDSSSPLLLDALATYSRMEHIHASRGKLFWLFHPNQNSSEKNAIATMKDELRRKFKCTDASLNMIKDMNFVSSSDAINLCSLEYGDKENYTSLVQKVNNRKAERKQLIDNLLDAIDRTKEDKEVQNKVHVNFDKNMTQNLENQEIEQKKVINKDKNLDKNLDKDLDKGLMNNKK